MFKILLSSLIHLVCCKIIWTTTVTTETFSDAIDSLLSNIFTSTYSNINIVKIDDHNVNEIVSNILKQNNKFTCAIEDYQSQSLTKATKQKRFFVILIFDSSENFQKFDHLLSTKAFIRNGFYLIVLINGNASDVENIFHVWWKKKFYNVNILISDMQSVNMFALMPFTDGKCENPTSVLINQFNRSTPK